jgi:hypothetical protein
MKYCLEKDVIDLFSLLNNENINYILIRNINNELPKSLPLNKDIDLMINEDEASNFNHLMQRNGWKQKNHPLGHFPFLYGLKPFEFYFKNGIHLDICFQLACRSLNKGEWFPLDMQIQEDLWNNKLKILDSPWKYQLSIEDEFVHLITRCVFDKKEFNNGYIERIEQLKKVINSNIVLSKFEVVFFKYSKLLFEQINKKEYDKIITNYLQFKDY